MDNICFRLGLTSSQPGKRVNLDGGASNRDGSWDPEEAGSKSAMFTYSQCHILSSRGLGIVGRPRPIITLLPEEAKEPDDWLLPARLVRAGIIQARESMGGLALKSPAAEKAGRSGMVAGIEPNTAAAGYI